MRKEDILNKLNKPLVNVNRLVCYLNEADKMGLSKTTQYKSKMKKLKRLFKGS